MMLPLPLFWASILAPLILGLVAAAKRELGRGLVNAVAYLSAAFLAIPGIVALAYSPRINLASWIVDPLFIDLRGSSIGVIALGLDGVSAPVVIGVSLVTALVSIYSIKYMTHRIEELRREGEEPPGLGVYFSLYNMFSISMLGMALSTNLLEFYVFLEISLVSSFALIALYGYGDRRRIALLYFIWTHVGGALFLIGILYYWTQVGLFDVVDVTGGRGVYVAESLAGSAALYAMVALVLGLLVKMAIVGVHMWLPYAHAEAPTPVSALLSPNLVGIGGYALARFALPIFPEGMERASTALIALSIATIIYGGLVALRQTDFKRFLAYSSISQMGYMLLGVSTLTAAGIGGAMLQYLSHAVGKAILFMVAGVFIAELSGLRDMGKMGGFAARYPLMAAAALLGFFHLVGIPPAIGMWGEVLLVIGYSQALGPYGAQALLLVAVTVIAAFTITAAYSFIAMRRIFFGPLRRNISGESLDAFKASIIVIGVIGVFLFIAVTPLSEGLRASSELLAAIGGGGS
ncbi:MAG: NuoM [Desulfurococcales archaeon]|nr:NuoM [Desulfurococcales archaeon]